MNQPDQPRSRRERKELERAAAQGDATQALPVSKEPAPSPVFRNAAGARNGSSGTSPATEHTFPAAAAGSAATAGQATPAGANGARPFVRPAQRNSRRTDDSLRVGSQGSAYGSGPQTQYTPEPTVQIAQVEPDYAQGAAQREPGRERLGFVRGTIRTFGELCITTGMILILFVVWQLWWTDIEANRDNSNLADQLTTQWKDNPRNELPEDPDTPLVAEMPAENEAFGIMYIPRFGEDYYRTMAEGISLEPVLNRMGVGRYPSTARPGEVGNFAVAGHRVTYGKPLNLIAEMQPGDDIVVQTAEGFYTYTMRNFEVILPTQTEVLAPVPAFPEYKGKDRIMTLTACNPMFSARERYVVYAELTEWRPAAEGAPDSIANSSAFKEAGGQ